jgi:hypothetical protein
MKIVIPESLNHLPVQGGYPVPYFVAWPEVNGKKRADFRLFDGKKQRSCLKYHLCFICGKKLPYESGFLVGGQSGLDNRVSSDTFMHEACARFALEACPHLAIQSLDRRESNLPENISKPDGAVPDKPDIICLIHADKHQLIQTQHGILINFRPKRVQRFHYQQGRLVPLDLQLLPYLAVHWRHGVAFNPQNL